MSNDIAWGLIAAAYWIITVITFVVLDDDMDALELSTGGKMLVSMLWFPISFAVTFRIVGRGLRRMMMRRRGK